MRIKLSGDVNATIEVATTADIADAIKQEFEKHEEVARDTVWKQTAADTYENDFGHEVTVETV